MVATLTLCVSRKMLSSVCLLPMPLAFHYSMLNILSDMVGMWAGLGGAPTLFSIFLSAMLEGAFRHIGDGVYIQSCQNAWLFTVTFFKAKTKTTNILVRELLFADNSPLITHSTEEIERIVDAFATASSNPVQKSLISAV